LPRQPAVYISLRYVPLSTKCYGRFFSDFFFLLRVLASLVFPFCVEATSLFFFSPYLAPPPGDLLLPRVFPSCKGLFRRGRVRDSGHLGRPVRCMRQRAPLFSRRTFFWYPSSPEFFPFAPDTQHFRAIFGRVERRVSFRYPFPLVIDFPRPGTGKFVWCSRRRRLRFRWDRLGLVL